MAIALLHLSSIKHEISAIKYILMKILNTLECQTQVFVSYKTQLTNYEVLQDHVTSFDTFLEDVNEKLLSANTKIALLEQETNFLTMALKEHECNQCEKSIDVKEEIFSTTIADDLEVNDLKHKSNDEHFKKTILLTSTENIESSTSNKRAHQNNLEKSKETPHHTPKLNTCKICKVNFNNVNQLQIHILKTHSLSDFQKYKCNFCSVKCSENKDLRKHRWSEHKQEYCYKCNECGKRFIEDSSLKSHLLNAHKIFKVEDLSVETNINTKVENGNQTRQTDQWYKCDICDKKYKFHRTLQRHKQINHESIFECATCQEEFKSGFQLTNHIYLHIEENSECTCCDIHFNDKYDLKMHILETHNIPLPKNESEQKLETSLKSRKGSRKRMNLCNSEAVELKKTRKSIGSYQMKSQIKNQLRCQLCSKNFKNLIQYVEHRQVHTISELSSLSPNNETETTLDLRSEKVLNSDGSTSYKCIICQRCFVNSGNVLRHTMTHTSEKPYYCDICEMRYHDFSGLAKHNLVKHSGEATIECEICSKCFYTNTGLKEHLRSHSGQKSFQCVTCGNCFTNSSNLRTHMKIHSGVKAFACPLCSYRCHSNNTLQFHLKATHYKIKSHTCELCGASYKQRCILLKHLRTHTGERPYQCNVCKKRYISNVTLKEHMTMHGGVRHSCPVCGKSYTYKRGLRVHMKNSCNRSSEGVT